MPKAKKKTKKKVSKKKTLKKKSKPKKKTVKKQVKKKSLTKKKKAPSKKAISKQSKKKAPSKKVKASEKKEKENPELLSSKAKQEEKEIVLTNDEGIPYCRGHSCDQLANVEGYCRYHYLLLWNRLKERKKILDSGELKIYIQEFSERYPEKCMSYLVKDMRTDKSFSLVVQELFKEEDIDALDVSDESAAFLEEEIKGIPEQSREKRRADY